MKRTPRIPQRLTETGEMPFLDHLEELRWRVLYSLIALLVGAVIGFVIVTELEVLDLLIRPIRPLLGEGQKLVYLSPADPFFITLKLAVLVGALLAAPIVVYQVWAFLSPALSPVERRSIVPAFYLGLILFAAGVGLAYFAALPVTLKFFAGFLTETLEANYVIGPYLELVVRMLLAFGLVFELPVVVLVLAVLGIVDARMLRAGRRYAIVIIAIVASLITPGDVVLLTVFLMIPLVLLYELSIGLASLVERRRRRAALDEPVEA